MARKLTEEQIKYQEQRQLEDARIEEMKRYLTDKIQKAYQSAIARAIQDPYAYSGESETDENIRLITIGEIKGIDRLHNILLNQYDEFSDKMARLRWGIEEPESNESDYDDAEDDDE